MTTPSPENAAVPRGNAPAGPLAGPPADPPVARRRSRGSLTRDVIIDAAIEVIDRGGIPGLTMRKLGQALGVDAMAIYGYFENKAELLDALVEREAQRLVAVPGPFPAEPVELIVSFGMHYRRVLLEHPNLAPLIAARPLPQTNWRASVTFGVTLFRVAGFDDEIIPLAADAMVGFTLGFVVHEAGQRALRAEMGENRAEHEAEVERQLAELGPEHAVEAKMIRQRLDDRARSEQFERGLRAMLHGLKAGFGTPPG